MQVYQKKRLKGDERPLKISSFFSGHASYFLLIVSLPDLLWKAPELLREADPPLCGTKKGDVYSFAIILEEFHTLKSPYSNSDIPARGAY